MMLLYPRLPNKIARELAEELRAVSGSEAIERSSCEHSEATYAPTGGTRAPRSVIKEIQTEVRRLGQLSGLTADGASDNEQLIRFDQKTAAFLHEKMSIPAGDAAHPGVWQFMACVVLPDITRARFPGSSGTNHRRFLGGPRNVLGRLWWRAHIFYDGSHDPLAPMMALGEDELVQIMERPEVAGHRQLVREIARQLVARDEAGDLPPNRMHVMRDVMKRVRRLLPIVSFDALEHEELVALVDQLYGRSLEAFGGAGSASNGRRKPGGFVRRLLGRGGGG